MSSRMTMCRFLTTKNRSSRVKVLYSQIYLFPANWRSREVDYYMIASSPHAPVCLSVSICNISVYNRGLLRPEFHSQPRLARLMPLTADV